MTKTDLALEFVRTDDYETTSIRLATVLACSQATAAGILARLFWRGLIDRRTVGRAFVYTPRAPRA